MKTRSLLLAFAGLGLFACSNEDLNNAAINGEATVTVNISEAISRAIETPSTGENGKKFPVEIKSAKLSLEADKGGAQDVDITNNFKNGAATHQFTGVRNPKSVTVVINDGKESDLALKDVVATGLAEPLYASSSAFTATNATNYTVSLTPAHRLARLQFSGIDFKTDGSSYTSLKLDGIYLNGAIKEEGKAEKFEENASGAWTKISEGSDAWEAKVYDAIGAVVIGENAVQGPWPAKEGEVDQCYAYNILPNAEGLPKLTVCFSEAEQNNVTSTNNTKFRYARVAKYKLTGEVGNLEGIEQGYITEFKAGYIYNITGLEIEDKNLGPTPEGGEDISLTATVTVTPMTLVNGTVEWN